MINVVCIEKEEKTENVEKNKLNTMLIVIKFANLP